jgi:hypothetical protein
MTFFKELIKKLNIQHLPENKKKVDAPNTKRSDAAT